MRPAQQSEPVRFPDKLRFLFDPHRYKVAYGGRGGAKSWGFARALLILGAQSPKRIVCAREIQKSIADSVHKLLCDQIKELGLAGVYAITQTAIRGKNGTEFSFHGLKHNVDSIKSLEGCDICWIEEAQNVSKSSWSTLIPTIRKDGSEIWVSFNPELEDDETYQRFVIRPPDSAKIVNINWSDNPWFPRVLHKELEDLKARSEADYLHVWEGRCRQALEGAIYAAELQRAAAESRITSVPYDPSKPVSTFWDLGSSDACAIWCAQVVGFEFRVIDFIQGRFAAASHYVKELQKRPYVWGTDWLPHDGAHTTQAAQALPVNERTIEGQLKSLGRQVRVIPNRPGAVADGINAARTIFDRCWFDRDKCADGLQALRYYRYEVDGDTGKFSPRPLHDWASNPADAFRTLAVALVQEPSPVKARRQFEHHREGGWMA